MESYGHIDPATGLSTRFGDFLNSLDQVVDFALEKDVDLVLFCGDAYKSREPSPTQQREFAQRLHKLVRGNIPVFLVAGNHDLPFALSRATAVEIFDTLQVEKVMVANRPGTYRVETKAGLLQIVALPWARRSPLLTREESKTMNLEEINSRLREKLTNILQDSLSQLDPHLSSILAGHLWVFGATYGSERTMLMGKDYFLLLSDIAHPALDYVALGHIHRHQVLSTHPPVVYAGSLQRLDFSDEGDEKGFFVVEFERKGKVDFQFHKVECRRFITLRLEITAQDSDPTSTLLQALALRREEIEGAIVRLEISLPASLQSPVQENEVRKALREAHYFTLALEKAEEKPRARLSGLAAEKLTPLEALKEYLRSKKTPPEEIKVLLEYGEKLLEAKKREEA